jgi:hypothetical protein
LIQRFSSAANLNIHLRCLVLDGLYRRSQAGPAVVKLPARRDRGDGRSLDARAWPGSLGQAEPDATTGRFDGEVVRVTTAQAAGDDPRAQALQALRAALLDPGEVNHVSEYLRGLAAS